MYECACVCLCVEVPGYTLTHFRIVPNSRPSVMACPRKRGKKLQLAVNVKKDQQGRENLGEAKALCFHCRRRSPLAHQ